MGLAVATQPATRPEPPARRVQVFLPTLHSQQSRILRESYTSRYQVVACGRRWGKTFLCHELAAQTILDGQPVGYFAPDYKRLVEYWEGMKSILLPITEYKSETEHRIKTLNGGSLECWTMEDEDAGRSRKYQRVILDEAGLVANLGARWSEAIRPTLTDLRGDAWFTGTPKGMNFFYQVYTKGNDPAQPRWQSWQMPSHANPYLSPRELDEMRAEMPDRAYRQEVLAEFIEDGGGVLRNVRGLSTLQPKAGPDPTHIYYAGIDWSSGGNDFTVVSVMDAVTHEQVALHRWSGLSSAVQIDRIIDIYKRWHWSDALAETNSIGRPLLDWLMHEAKLPVRGWHTDNDSKRILIERYAVGFEQSALRLLDDETQIIEHEAIESTRTPGGLVRYAAPEGLHDDTVIAGGLAWELARESHKVREIDDRPRGDERLVSDMPGYKKRFPKVAKVRATWQ